MSQGHLRTTRRRAVLTACDSGPCQTTESLPPKGTCLFRGLSWKVRARLTPSPSGRDGAGRVTTHPFTQLSVLWMASIAHDVGRLDSRHGACLEWPKASHSGCALSGACLITFSLSHPTFRSEHLWKYMHLSNKMLQFQMSATLQKVIIWLGFFKPWKSLFHFHAL